MTLQQKNYHTRQIANAIQRCEGMYSISLEEGNGLINYEFALPTPQTCGTMTQQRTYAMDKATSLIEKI